MALIDLRALGHYCHKLCSCIIPKIKEFEEKCKPYTNPIFCANWLTLKNFKLFFFKLILISKA